MNINDNIEHEAGMKHANSNRVSSKSNRNDYKKILNKEVYMSLHFLLTAYVNKIIIFYRHSLHLKSFVMVTNSSGTIDVSFSTHYCSLD